jgi:GT2 family glycosyltransferase
MSDIPGAPREQEIDIAARAEEPVLVKENAKLQHENAELRNENAFLKARLEGIVASPSWRATVPLRFAQRLARGEWRAARKSVGIGLSICYHSLRVCYHKLLPRPLREKVAFGRVRLRNIAHTIGHSPVNRAALQAIVDRRCAFAKGFSANPVIPAAPAEWPFIDVTVVCFNSRKWLDGFVGSLIGQAYPLEKIHLRFVDHGSSDGTVEALREIKDREGSRFASFELLVQQNLGFGAGHNTGIRAGQSPYCLVTNADLTFEGDALVRIVTKACADEADVACWELRQKPYEHPKFYDPITGETNWNAHACVLLRRSAFEAIGGYDENIFMYGEDVELSYRLRRHGFRLRYCPEAVVWHFTYEHESQIKPLQFTGSIFANLYLRLKFGTWRDIAVIPYLSARLLLAREVYPGSRKGLIKSLKRLIGLMPQALRQRGRSTALFPFHRWDYDFARAGAFVEAPRDGHRKPLISIVTRTYRGRETYLVQCVLSVMGQTYSPIEHVIVEDGGDTLREVIERMSHATSANLRYFPLAKVGRSAAGNAGLAAATGEFVLFLDDDDLFFADHVETLVGAMASNPDAAAAYSLAWEVPTDAGRLSDGYYEEYEPIFNEAMRRSFDPEVLKQFNYLPIQAILFQRELYLQRGGFEEDLEALEDWNLWNRYAVGNNFIFVPKVTSLFRVPSDPQIANKRAQALRKAYEPVFTRNIREIQVLEEALQQSSELTSNRA